MRPLTSVAMAWLFSATAACAADGAKQRPEEEPMGHKTIKDVISDHAATLMARPGVVGVAQGECAGRPCIKVLVAKKIPELLGKIPSAIEG